MGLRWIAAVALLVGATGCWMEACDYGDSCEERLTGLFDPAVADDAGDSWCGGQSSLGRDCQDLGYPVDCGGVWYRRGSAPYDCR